MKYTMADLEAYKTPEELTTYRSALAGRLQELDAEFAGKRMDADARAEFADIKEIDKEAAATIVELQARREYLHGLTAKPAQVDKPFAGITIAKKASHVPDDVFATDQYRSLSDSEPQLLQAYRDGAMFAAERTSYPNPRSVKETEQAHIQELLDNNDLPTASNPNRELARRMLATGSPAYLREFTKYVQGRPDAFRAVGAWTVQTDATGGYAVPFYFDPSILHTGSWLGANAYRQACEIKTIVGTDTYHGATAGAFTVARAGEAVAATEGGPAVGQISAIVGKVQGVGSMSVELLQDRPDVVSEIASLISEAKDNEESLSFSAGVGAALGAGYTPIGMFALTHDTSGAFTHIDTAAAAGVIAAADLYNIEAGLPLRHRQNAAWFMGRDVLRLIEALETVNGQLFGGQYYASVTGPGPAPGGNTGRKLLGYPVWETPGNTAYADTNDLPVACLCNPKQYYIIERAGMTVETIPHMVDADGLLTGQRGIYAWWRNTAKPANIDAGRRLTLLS